VERGQASLEYVGIVALLAFAVAGGTAVAAPDLPRALVHHARVALCIVGGDVCRTADARAQGLEPCVVGSEVRGKRDGLTIAIVRVRRGGEIRIERRSDGSAVVSRRDGGTIEGTTGASLRLGPLFQAGATIAGGVGFAAGRAWEVADEAALRRLLADLDDAPPPSARFLEGGNQMDAGVTLADHDLAGGEMRRALGRRVSGGRTTYYYGFDGAASGPVAAAAGVPAGGAWVAEWEEADPPVLTLRSERTEGGTVTETIARVALRTPEEAGWARRLILLRGTGPLSLVLGRRLQARLEAHGSVETRTYAETREDGGFDAGVHAIVGLGAEHSSTTVRRRLVDARVVRPETAERADCVGV
jgi:hypothetical protein